MIFKHMRQHQSLTPPQLRKRISISSRIRWLRSGGDVRAGWPLCLLALLLILGGAQTQAATHQVVLGHRPAAADKAAVVGQLSGEQEIYFGIGLPLRNESELAALLDRLYDPTSPDFHHYLTPAEFAERYGPTEADYEGVVRYARAQGFTVNATHGNRMFVGLSASVAAVENAFQIHFLAQQHPTEGRTFFAPDREPTLDLTVPVLHISGLDDFIQTRPADLVKRRCDPATGPHPLDGSGIAGTFQGGDFRAAYAPNVALSGVGQFVGLLEFDGYDPRDIAQYVTMAGLTNVPTQNVLIDGFDGSVSPGNVEVPMDIEMVLCMAPGIAGLFVYEGKLANDILSRMAADSFVKQLSSSWGFSSDATSVQIFNQFIAQGQSFFQASGDSGAYPSVAPFPKDNWSVITVGGTTLSTLGPAQGWVSETVWHSSGGSSGGGICNTVPLPTWQKGIATKANRASTIRRNVPDVAMVADGILVVADHGGQFISGGTSAAAPLWAGFMALVNQQAAQNGVAAAGFINPAIYSLAKTNTSAFHDITTGNNTNSNTTNYFATPGYDLCTGWGTPTGQSLIDALAPRIKAPVLKPAGYTLNFESSQPANGVVDPGEAVVVSFSLQNIGGVDPTNLVATLLNTNGILFAGDAQTYGPLGAGGAPVSRSFSFMADPALACGTTITPTFQLQDGMTNLGTISFSLPVGQSIQTFSENFDAAVAPALPAGWTGSTTGGASKWITTGAARDSGTNAAFVQGTAYRGVAELISPPISLTTSNAQLSFRNFYVMEINSTANSTTAYDGGVLEISINNDVYQDILTAGGSFVTNGYTRTIRSNPAGDNPLDRRQVWAGTSPGFVPVIVNLPASAAGQIVRFKWRLGSDLGGSSSWYLDSVAVQDGTLCSSVPSTADLAVTQAASPATGLVGQTVTYVLSVSNLGPATVLNTTVTDVLPANATLVSASPGGTLVAGSVLFNSAILTNGGYTNFVVVVSPTQEGTLTNSVTVASPSAVDTLADNNTSMVSTTVLDPATIKANPTSQIVSVGADLTLSVAASGTQPLAFQWAHAGTNLVGATDATLFLPGIQPEQAGDYTVTVSNIVSVATSGAAQVVVATSPVILSGPASQSMPAGANTALKVVAAGGSPLSYQWMLGGTNLAGATDAILLLASVQPAQAGNYSVLVSNSFGLATSSLAKLKVLVLPVIDSGTISLTGASFSLTVQSIPGLVYLLEYKNSLSDNAWTPLAPGAFGDGTVITLSDKNAAGQPSRYYRVRSNLMTRNGPKRR